MWLFSQRGFYSIVQHKEDAKLLMVKARVKGDIEKYWLLHPGGSSQRTEDFDYLYRSTMKRKYVEEVVNKMVQDIDYTSYKGTLEDPRRYDWYVRIWETLCAMQEAFKQDETEESAIFQK